MRLRPALAVAALLAAAAPAAADPPKPALVVRTKPGSELLARYKEMVRQVGGPEAGARLVKQVDADIKDLLGEEGFEGVDLTRPLAAYAVLKDDPDDCGLVLLVPVTGEKEFLGLLGRLKIDAEAVKDQKGLYTLDLDGPFQKDSHLRFADGGWAYLTLNDGDPTPAKDLVPAADLTDPADPALVAATLYPDRVPAKLLGFLLDNLDQAAAGLKMLFAAGGGPDAEAKLYTAVLEQGPKLVRRYAERGVKEAAEVRVTFAFDPATGETVTELTVVPKPGTALAKDLAAKPATANRFAGLVPKDAAAGLVVKAPLFAPEIREIGAALAEGVGAELKGVDVPDRLRAVLAEGVKGLGRAAKKGDVDAAVALLGPDKAGQFTLVGGFSLDDPAAVERALRDAAKDPAFGKGFEFDAAKAGGVGVHKVPLAGLLDDDVRERFAKVIGEKPPGYVAFAKDAVFVGFGPGALDAVRAALEAKPGPAPVVDVTANMARLHKLVGAVDERAGAMFAKHLGTDDKAVTPLRVTVEGGAALKVRAAFNVRHLPALLMADTGGAAAPVKPPPPR